MILKRIIYYSEYQLAIFHWESEKCVAAYTFKAGEEGLKKFETYLLATDNTPVRMLVDLTGEDFCKEVVPHVGATDRRAIVARMIQRQYRKSKDYVYYKIIDRQTVGRRDDVLLYSVLANPEVLQLWLKVLNKCRTSICGIWSLPQLSEAMLSRLDINAPNIILITQQTPCNLRQSFIKNNKLQSSRLAIVNLEDASIGQHISLEVEQTIQFLSNHRHISFDEKIEIHIMCRESDIEEVLIHCTDSTSRTYYYHKLKDIAELLGCDFQLIEQACPQIAEYSTGLFSYVCASKLLPIGHYGNRMIFFKFYEQILSRAIYALSSVILIVSTIMTLGYLSDAKSLNEESIALKEQADAVNNQYKNKLEKFKHKLSQTRSMQSSVLLAEKIYHYKSLSPQNFMSDISQILTRTGMKDTEIKRINWQQLQSNDLPVIGSNRNKKQIDYSKPEAINQFATIVGHIRLSSESLIEATTKVNSIVHAFKVNQLVKQVKVNTMPVDFRSKSSIENESGLDDKISGEQNKNNGWFEIEIMMKGNLNADPY